MEQTFTRRFQHDERYLPIRVGDILCALELKRVHQVLSLMKLEPVPTAPDYVVGVFNYHGMVVPVVDLALRFGLDSAVQSYFVETTEVVLCETIERGVLLGVIGSVVETQILQLSFNKFQLEPELSAKTMPFFACCEVQGENCFILDAGVLLASSLSDFNASLPEDIRRAINQYNKTHVAKQFGGEL